MRRLLLPASFVVSICIVGLVGLNAVRDREITITDATADAVNLRNALIEQTRQTFAAIDIALTGVAENIDTQDLGSEVTYGTLVVRQDAFAPTFAIFILDESGQNVATSRTPDPAPFDFSADQTFLTHANSPSLGLLIAPPRKGRVGFAEDRWIVNVSRRLNHPDGSFAGVVAAVVSIDYLTNFYDALRRGEGGVVGISKDDGTVIARSPFREDYIGRALIDTQLFREMLPSADAGVYRAQFVTDDTDRITAYSRVPDFPLVVYVGISATERLAAWRQRATIDGVIGLLAIFMLGGLTYFAERRTGERQREQEARVKQLTELTEVSVRLMECPDVGTALQLATDMARELVPSHQAVTSLTEHPSMAQTIHTVSFSEKYAAWNKYDETPDGSGIYRKVCEDNQPMRLTQAELETHSDWKGFGAARERHSPMRGWLAVPLIADDGRNLGLIQLSDRMTGDFTAEDQALIIELAHVTRLAIQRLKMSDQLRDAAATAERLRSEVESVLTSIRDAVYALDEDWRFTFLNRQAEILLERKAEDLIGRRKWDEFPEAVETELFTQYHKARDSNVDVDFRLYYQPLKGWFDVRAFPRKEGGLTVYFQDVSDILIQEEKLRQAQKLEAVGQLTGGVAHDFNNLLTVILGNAETLAEELTEHKQLRDLAKMTVTAAERGAELTNRLLAFSRKQALEPKVLSLSSQIHGMESLLRRTLPESIDIEIVAAGGLWRAEVDPGQLESALLNLAINARDAMPDGGHLTIEMTNAALNEDYVALEQDLAPGQYVMIAVTDTGQGMSSEVLDRVFEPFFTTKEVGKGSGLGLSMVYGFVKQSGGHIRIYSEPGEGTSVKIYFPRARGGHELAATDRSGGAIVGGNETILVVEDDELVREQLVARLIGLGYNVASVENGPLALKILDTIPDLDLLLTDIVLPGGMSGRVLADTLRESRPDLKVLFTSGYTENAIVHHGRLDPGVELLSKPYRREQLAAKVRKVLDAPES